MLRCCLVAFKVSRGLTASAAVPVLDPTVAAAGGARLEVCSDTDACLQDIWDGWGSYPEKIQNCPVSTFDRLPYPCPESTCHSLGTKLSSTCICTTTPDWGPGRLLNLDL